MARIRTGEASADPMIHRMVALCRSVRSSKRRSMRSKKMPFNVVQHLVTRVQPRIDRLPELADFRGGILKPGPGRFPKPANFRLHRFPESADFRGEPLEIGLGRAFDLPSLLYGPPHVRHNNPFLSSLIAGPLPNLPARKGSCPGVPSRGSAVPSPCPAAPQASERAGTAPGAVYGLDAGWFQQWIAFSGFL